jgi:hypothetical protein
MCSILVIEARRTPFGVVVAVSTFDCHSHFHIYKGNLNASIKFSCLLNGRMSVLKMCNPDQASKPWVTKVVGLIVMFTLSVAFAVPVGALTPAHTVTFFEQASIVDNNIYFEVSSTSSFLTPISTFTPPFTNPGHTFVNWNTAANGSGTSFTDGANYLFTADIGLYAQWKVVAVAHTVTFLENAISTDALSSFITSTTSLPLTLFPAIAPSFSNPGHTFVNWNTAANGSGTSFLDGESYSFAADITLYAQWALVPVVLTQFVSNGGTGAVAPVSYPVGSTTTLPTISGVTNPGHTFVNWNTAANGSGTSYMGGSSYVFTGDQTLYAQWIANVYQVTYAGNGGSVSPSVFTFTYGTSALVLPTPTNAGSTFNGWFTAPTGGSLIGLGGVGYSPGASTVLYAQWTHVIIDTLTFNANGGSGAVAPISGPHGSLITLPGQLGLLNAGYVMSRWTSTSNGSGTSYTVGQTITLTGSSVLFAQWSGHKAAVLFGAVGNFAKNSSMLSASLRSQVRHLASTVKAKKYHSVLLFGYTATTGLQSLNVALSRARAKGVANYLREELRALNVKGVSIASAGEGAIAGGTIAAYSRVEVFVL